MCQPLLSTFKYSYIDHVWGEFNQGGKEIKPSAAAHKWMSLQVLSTLSFGGCNLLLYPPRLCGWALFSFTLFLNFAMCFDQASSKVSATDKFCCSIFENGEDDCCEGGYIWRWLRRDIAATLRTISVKLSCCSILCKCPDFILLIRTLSQSNGCISKIIGFDSGLNLSSLHSEMDKGRVS